GVGDPGVGATLTATRHPAGARTAPAWAAATRTPATRAGTATARAAASAGLTLLGRRAGPLGLVVLLGRGLLVAQDLFHRNEAVPVQVHRFELAHRLALGQPLVQADLGVLVGVVLDEPRRQFLGQVTGPVDDGPLLLLHRRRPGESRLAAGGPD